MDQIQAVGRCRALKKVGIKSIVVLAAICLVTSAALAVVNHFTAPIITAAAQTREDASRRAVLPQAAAFEVLPSDALPETVTAAYAGLDGAGHVVGYVFTAQGRGFDGDITVMAAIDPTGVIVQVATIDVTSETKTLGGQTADAGYTGQYIGQDSSLSAVDAISGATITSDAYEGCVRDCFAAFDAVKGG